MKNYSIKVSGVGSADTYLEQNRATPAEAICKLFEKLAASPHDTDSMEGGTVIIEFNEIKTA